MKYVAHVMMAAALLLCSCSDNTRTDVSAVQAKQKQYWDAIHSSLERDRIYPFTVASQPCLIHIPEQYASKMKITVSDGKPYDPFQENNKPFYFARINADECMLISPGPDRVLNINEATIEKLSIMKSDERIKQILNISYDPSNGTVSAGDIIRTGMF